MTVIAIGFIVAPMVDTVMPLSIRASLRKVGGLWFWRLGRIGGSFYVARKGN